MDYFICQACNTKHENACTLNKHLSVCLNYDEWIKTYIPPHYRTCHDCNLVFAQNSNHSCFISDNSVKSLSD